MTVLFVLSMMCSGIRDVVPRSQPSQNSQYKRDLFTEKFGTEQRLINNLQRHTHTILSPDSRAALPPAAGTQTVKSLLISLNQASLGRRARRLINKAIHQHTTSRTTRPRQLSGKSGPLNREQRGWARRPTLCPQTLLEGRHGASQQTYHQEGADLSAGAICT